MSSPKTFTADVAAHAGDQLVEAHLDRLRELVVVAGELARLASRSARPARPCGLCGSGHSAARLQHHERVRDARRHRVGRDLRRADLGEDIRRPPGIRCSTLLERVCISTACVRLVPGMRSACTRCRLRRGSGTNSLPMREASHARISDDEHGAAGDHSGRRCGAHAASSRHVQPRAPSA